MRTGAGPQRGIRSSQLLFGWRARYGSLAAYTGQQSYFTIETAGVGGAVVGRNGTSVVGGHGQPRWVQVTPGFVTQFQVEGSEVGGQDTERYYHDYGTRVQSCSMYVKVTPLYAKAANLPAPKWLCLIGNVTTNGGYFALQRETTNWRAVRVRGGTTLNPGFTEPGSITYPVEVMATLSSGGQVSLFSRDAAGVLQNGTTTPTDANMCITTENWGSPFFYMAAGDGGGRWRYEVVKIARGVKTFAQMDLLS